MSTAATHTMPTELSRQLADRNRGRLPVAPWWMHLALMLFLVSCVFDPADRLLGAKVWLFLLCWAGTLATCDWRSRSVSPALLAYSIAFVAIPLASVALYWLRNGGEPYEGLALLKGYLLIGLAPMLALSRIDLLPALCAVLTVLALTIIGTFVTLRLEPDLYAALYLFGASTGIVLLDMREYGSDLSLLQVYFVTSPMLAIPITYYFVRAWTAVRRREALRCWVLTLLNIAGMLLAGTRNNMLVSALLPIGLFVLCARHRAVGALGALLVVTAAAALYAGELAALLDPTELSNQIKLAMLRDYARAFENPIDLLIGQGLGAYHYWEAKSDFYFISELTYLELLRNFGLFGAAAMLALLAFPIVRSFQRHRGLGEKGLALGYFAYLVMCISNPNLFSSMGITFLSVMLANLYRKRNALPRTSSRTSA